MSKLQTFQKEQPLNDLSDHQPWLVKPNWKEMKDNAGIALDILISLSCCSKCLQEFRVVASIALPNTT